MIERGTMSDDAVVIGVVGHAHEPRPAIVAAIAAAGATAEALSEATALSKGSGLGALLFDAGDAPERLAPLAAALGSDPRTRFLPRVIVVAEGVGAVRLAAFGAATIVPEATLEGALDSAIAGVVERLRERGDALRTAQAARVDLRALEKTLTALQQEAGTLSHDARVLFGIILGFASNLRDGFGGPVTELQHRQLVNIVEASTDAGALLDRHVSALRRLVPPAAERNGGPARVAARRLVDLADLVRGTIGLFQGLAAAKRIRLSADTAIAAPAWCDAMQMKQALVNLVSNALKFTPAGGLVVVAVRSGAATAYEESPEQRDVEIAVSDSGPGIPAADRERVFDRGVRLERDAALPGTGAGLAIVRDIVTAHGGVVRIDDTAEGGASIVLVLPADLRGRSGEHALVNVSPAPPRVRSPSVTSTSPRRTELRRERE